MKYPWTACVSLAAFIFTSQPLFGVPGFARKYETSCLTCHVAPPKLNAFGRAFKNLGYRMPGGEEGLVKQKEVSLGAPAWKLVFPEAVWPSTIPGGEFMAIALDSNFEVNRSREVTNSFDGIGEIGLLLGGTLGESLSFFGDVELFEGGQPGHIGRLFFQYNNPNRYFNVKVGQFEPRARPFSNHLRLTRISNYLSNVFPTVPAGNFFGFSPNQRGIEIWGAREGFGTKGGLTWAFGVVNGEFGGAAEALEDSAVGQIIEAMEEAAETGHHGGFDVNSEKDYYFQTSYKFGGMSVFGSSTQGDLRQTNNWRDNSLTLGAYFYRGTTGAFMDPHETEGPGEEDHHAALRLPGFASGTEEGGHGDGEQFFDRSGNKFYRTGVTFDAWLWDLNLFGGWQRNLDRLRDGRVYELDIPMVEAHYVTPWPWVQPAIRFEQVRSSFGGPFNRWTPSLTFLVRANVLFTVEGVMSGDSAPDLPPFDNRVQAGIRLYF